MLFLKLIWFWLKRSEGNDDTNSWNGEGEDFGGKHIQSKAYRWGGDGRL